MLQKTQCCFSVSSKHVFSFCCFHVYYVRFIAIYFVCQPKTWTKSDKPKWTLYLHEKKSEHKKFQIQKKSKYKNKHVLRRTWPSTLTLSRFSCQFNCTNIIIVLLRTIPIEANDFIQKSRTSIHYNLFLVTV